MIRTRGAGQTRHALTTKLDHSSGADHDSLGDTRRKLALWRCDYDNVRPHSSLGNKTPADAHRTLEQLEGSATGALAQTKDDEYENQTRKLSV